VIGSCVATQLQFDVHESVSLPKSDAEVV
jgi:hypothetical protein